MANCASHVIHVWCFMCIYTCFTHVFAIHINTPVFLHMLYMCTLCTCMSYVANTCVNVLAIYMYYMYYALYNVLQVYEFNVSCAKKSHMYYICITCKTHVADDILNMLDLGIYFCHIHCQGGEGVIVFTEIGGRG